MAMAKRSTSLPDKEDRELLALIDEGGKYEGATVSFAMSEVLKIGLAAIRGQEEKESAEAKEIMEMGRNNAQSIDMIFKCMTDSEGKSEITNMREAAQGIRDTAQEIKSRMVEPRFLLAACAVIGTVSGIVGALMGAVL